MPIDPRSAVLPGADSLEQEFRVEPTELGLSKPQMQLGDSLAETAEILGHDFDPGLTRRNVTISAGVIPTRPGQRIQIGDVLLEVVRPAAPCRLMDEQIGDGARRALSGRAGAIFRALTSGTIAVGDPVVVEPVRE